MKCIVCMQEKNSSEEHIVPEVLGNRFFITDRVCEKCNNDFGTFVDKPFTDNTLFKLIRIGDKLPGSERIKLFHGMEKDIKTGRKFQVRGDRIIPCPNIESDENGIRVEAENGSECISELKKHLKRQGYSDDSIKNSLSKIISGEIEIDTPTFAVNDEINFSVLSLEVIKMAYEYTHLKLGDIYLEDPISRFIRATLIDVINSTDRRKGASEKLAKYVCFLNLQDDNSNYLRGYLDEMKENGTDAYHLFCLTLNDGELYCVMSICSELFFSVKVSENADLYQVTFPIISVVDKDGRYVVR